MSFQAMAWAVKQKVGNATGKAILLMLANYADDRGECFPSQERLAGECECSVATVARWLGLFVEMGFMTRHKQYGEGGYRRADLLRIATDLPITKLPSKELPNSASKLTHHSDGAEPIKEPIITSLVREPGEFDQFWQAFPNKVGKRAAEKSFIAARKRVSFPDLMAGLAAYTGKADDRHWCNPTTWLNQDRWLDRPSQQPARAGPAKPMTASQMLLHRRNENRDQADDERSPDRTRVIAAR